MLTKTDLKVIEFLFDRKFDEKFKIAIKPVKNAIKSLENRMVAKFNEVIDHFDDKIIDHEKRIRNLETSFRPD